MLFFASPLLAHNTSVTWIDVKIEGPQLAITLNLNQSDLLEHVLGAPSSQPRFTDLRELEDAAPRVLTYVIENLQIRADGKPLGPPISRAWPPLHPELTHLDANGLEVPSIISLNLRYLLQANSRHLEIRPKLFNMPNFSAIFDVSISTRQRPKPVMTIVARHEPVVFDLDNSAEPARTNSLSASPPHRTRFWVTINVLLAAVVVTLWWWRRTWYSR